MTNPDLKGTLTGGLHFRDDVFASADSWQLYYADRRFVQRYKHEDRLIFSETLLSVQGTLEAALSLMQGPWHWWDNGRIIGFRRREDQCTEQVLAPVWWYWTRVGVITLPPVELKNGEGLRLPILLSRHFRGPASVDFLQPDGPAGPLVLRGRFHGVENHVPFVHLDLASRVHLRAEAGTFFYPFPGKTGWCGLCRRLKGRCASAPCCSGTRFPGTRREKQVIRR